MWDPLDIRSDQFPDGKTEKEFDIVMSVQFHSLAIFHVQLWNMFDIYVYKCIWQKCNTTFACTNIVHKNVIQDLHVQMYLTNSLYNIYMYINVFDKKCKYNLRAVRIICCSESWNEGIMSGIIGRPKMETNSGDYLVVIWWYGDNSDDMMTYAWLYYCADDIKKWWQFDIYVIILWCLLDLGEDVPLGHNRKDERILTVGELSRLVWVLKNKKNIISLILAFRVINYFKQWYFSPNLPAICNTPS